MIIDWNLTDTYQFGTGVIQNYLNLETGITSIWSDASTNTALWYTQNPIATIWDGGATNWDLDGNVYMTLYDTQDETYSDAATNAVTWTDA